MNWYKVITSQRQQLMFYPWQQYDQETGQTVPYKTEEVPSQQQPTIDQSTGEAFYKCLICNNFFPVSDIGADQDENEVWLAHPDESKWNQYEYPDAIDENKLQSEVEHIYSLLKLYYDEMVKRKAEKEEPTSYWSNESIEIPDVQEALASAEEIKKYCNMRYSIGDTSYMGYNICNFINRSSVTEHELLAMTNDEGIDRRMLDIMNKAQQRDFSVPVEHPICEDCYKELPKCVECNKAILDTQNAYPMKEGWGSDQFVCRECIEDGTTDIGICYECGEADSPDDMHYMEDQGAMCQDCFEEIDDVELWRSQIDDAADESPYPFAHWFKEYEYGDEYQDNPDDDYELEGRIYIPFVSDNQITRDDTKVMSLLRSRGCTLNVIDYQEGYCIYKGQKVRIGKRMNAFHKEDLKNSANFVEKALASTAFSDQKKQQIVEKHSATVLEEEHQKLLNAFMTSPYRKLKKTSDISVVISQNPDDIAAMSTGRDWSSCMHLGKFHGQSNVFCYIEEGSLIAYAIKKDDTDIQKPLARILIRRFTNKEGVSIAIPEENYLGNAPQGFYDFVNNWLEIKQRDLPHGLYNMVGDSRSETLDRKHRKKAELIAKLIKSGIGWYKALKIAEEKISELVS